MVLGKFMPPHLGHVFLVEFAREYVKDLTVVVGTLKAEPIPGELRYGWMRELFPDVRVVHLTDENPQYPHEHPRFWDIWRDSLQRVLPVKPDYVFASEEYGAKLAEVLGAEFVPVDIARGAVPVSGTAIRNDPWTHWAEAKKERMPRLDWTGLLRRTFVLDVLACAGRRTLVKPDRGVQTLPCSRAANSAPSISRIPSLCASSLAPEVNVLVVTTIPRVPAL
jgi:NadR type nicotinamide-nucleotide adenylyltransferase